MNRTALLFDLDGTLVDSLPDLQTALNEMLRGFGGRELTAGEVRQMIGDGSRALVTRALGETGTVVELDRAHSRFLALYEAAPTARSRLYPGVVDTLTALRASGARLAVCTNKPQSGTLGVLQGFGIAGYFDVLLGGDAVSFKKPDPRHLLTAIERLGATPGEAVMIGDNEHDYAAARAAGVPVLMVRYGYLRVPAESLAPEAWLDCFADLPDALMNLKSASSGSTAAD